jgi:hypothetical protein
MKTRVLNGRDGWDIESQCDLDENRVLKIRTFRNAYCTLSTKASVWHCDSTGFMRHAFGFGSGGDFAETLITANVRRATKGVVEEQHSRAISNMQSIKDRVTAHYAIPANAKASADVNAVEALMKAVKDGCDVPS